MGKEKRDEILERLKLLEKKVENLERLVASLEKERATGEKKKEKLESRMIWENLPLTIIIIFLAILAANWFCKKVLGLD